MSDQAGADAAAVASVAAAVGVWLALPYL